MRRFPTLRQRRVAFGARVRHTVREEVFCISSCRMPNESDRAMISCDSCKAWFHIDCVKLNKDDSFSFSWNCNNCQTFFEKLYFLLLIIFFHQSYNSSTGKESTTDLCTRKGNPGGHGFQEVLGKSYRKGNPGGFQEVYTGREFHYSTRCTREREPRWVPRGIYILGESSIIPLDILGKGTQVGSKRYWERVPLFH